MSTPEQFIALKDRTDRGTAAAPLDIVFTNDLDFSEISDFEGLGNAVLYANINGNGYAIKNLTANSSGAFYLISRVSNGTIKNITIDNCHITTSGSLYIFYSQLCNYENIVIKNNNTFVSLNEMHVIYSASNSGITVTKVAVGGTYNCNKYFGLYLGSSSPSKISNCYVVANITCNNICHTFGYINGCEGVFNCFTRCNITNTSAKGTYYGFCYSYSKVKTFYCYAANQISGSFSTYYNLGNNLTATSCFYDSTLDTSPQNGEGLPATTSQLKSAEWLRSQGWAI